MKVSSLNKSVKNPRKVVHESTIKKELLASEIHYRRLFESAKDGIVILDAGSGKIKRRSSNAISVTSQNVRRERTI